MKKVISVLLAVLMLFSTATVAFAGDAAEAETTTTTAAATTEGDNAENDNPLAGMDSAELEEFFANMSWAEFKAIFKIAKIAVKLVLVLDKLGFVDLSPIRNAILDMVWNLIKDEINKDDTSTTVAPETTEAVAAA